MMYDARQPLRTFTRSQTFHFVLDQRRHNVLPSQSQAAQNHYCHRDNRTRQQRPHEKAALSEESKDSIHGFRSFDSYRSKDHRFGKIMKPSPSTSKPSGGKVFATSSGIGGRCASSTDCTQTFANVSFELFSVTLRPFTRPLRSILNRSRKVPMVIKSRFCSTKAYQREPIESATIFW